MPVALSCPPWHGGHDGGDLVAGNLTDGEISPVNREPCSGLTDRWGQLTLWVPPVCHSVWVLGVDPGGSSIFEPGFSEKNKRNDLQILFKGFGNL